MLLWLQAVYVTMAVAGGGGGHWGGPYGGYAAYYAYPGPGNFGGGGHYGGHQSYGGYGGYGGYGYEYGGYRRDDAGAGMYLCVFVCLCMPLLECLAP